MTVEFPCNQSMVCDKAKYPYVLDLKEISRLSFEHCYQTHIFDESWDHKKTSLNGSVSSFPLSNVDIE